MASVDDVDELIEQYHLAYASGRRTYLLRSPHGRVGDGRRFDTLGSHDAIREGVAIVVWRVVHSRVTTRRAVGLGRAQREHRVRDSLGVDRLRAVVAEGHS